MRDGRAVDQGRQAGGKDEAVELPALPVESGRAGAERSYLDNLIAPVQLPSGVNQELRNDVRAYILRSANQEFAPSLRYPASNLELIR